MSRFSSEQELYEQLGERLAGGVAARLTSADAVIQYRLTEPHATVTVDARKASAPKVDLGETALEPSIVLGMPADVADRLFAGEIELVGALARGEISGKGPVAKLLRALPASMPASGQEQPAETEATADAETPAGEQVAAVESPAAEQVAAADTPAAELEQSDAAPETVDAADQDPAPDDEAAAPPPAGA